MISFVRGFDIFARHWLSAPSGFLARHEKQSRCNLGHNYAPSLNLEHYKTSVFILFRSFQIRCWLSSSIPEWQNPKSSWSPRVLSDTLIDLSQRRSSQVLSSKMKSCKKSISVAMKPFAQRYAVGRLLFYYCATVRKQHWNRTNNQTIEQIKLYYYQT